MSHYHISSGNLSVSNSYSVSKDVPPTLTWTVNGSLNNPNNRFRVSFYDTDDNLLARSSVFDSTLSYTSTYTYNVTSSMWDDVVGNYYGNRDIKIYVESYNSAAPVSGPYPSNCCYFTVTIDPTEIYVENDRYVEEVFSIEAGEHVEFSVTFETTHYYVIQTFGDKDVCMEIYNGNNTLYAEDDDSGHSLNSYIYKTFYANTEYIIKINYYSEHHSGKSKLTITPAQTRKTSEAGSIDEYENIYLMQTTSSMSISCTLRKNYSTVYRFKTTSAGDYTFAISSDLDTFLYVIDPRSSEAVEFDVDYNDDDGEGNNPLLTRHLDANVDYFVVVCLYDPASITSGESVTLSISRE